MSSISTTIQYANILPPSLGPSSADDDTDFSMVIRR